MEFVAGLAPGDDESTVADRDRLIQALETIRVDREDVPPVELMEQEELTRHLVVSVGLRDRIRAAIVLKGRIPRGSTAPAGRTPAGVRQLVR